MVPQLSGNARIVCCNRRWYSKTKLSMPVFCGLPLNCWIWKCIRWISLGLQMGFLVLFFFFFDMQAIKCCSPAVCAVFLRINWLRLEKTKHLHSHNDPTTLLDVCVFHYPWTKATCWTQNAIKNLSSILPPAPNTCPHTQTNLNAPCLCRLMSTWNSVHMKVLKRWNVPNTLLHL